MTEVSLENGDQKWCLRRGPQGVMQVVPSAPVPAAQPVAAAAAPAEASAEQKVDDGPSIVSPTVGTYYSAPNPDDPAFVKVGTTVQPDTIVCIVEAMKVFNQIPAEVSGTIVELLVNNGDSVEFGQPLFRVSPN
jgi:acetyl-CoA carboxylase biotin carboxyl carrier protein